MFFRQDSTSPENFRSGKTLWNNPSKRYSVYRLLKEMIYKKTNIIECIEHIIAES